MPPSNAPVTSATEGGLLARTLAHWAEQGWSTDTLGRFRMEADGDPFEGLSDADVEAIVSLSDEDVTALEALSDEDRSALAPTQGTDLERRLARANREAANRRHALRPWAEIAKDFDMTPEQVRDALTKAKGKPKKDDDAGNGDDPPDTDAIRRQARREADQKANLRLVKAEVKLAASELFADPADAAAFLDLDKYEVDDDGELVDPDELQDDLADLLDRKPHLAKKKAGERKTPKPDPGQGRREDKKAGLDAGAERARERFGTKKDDAA